jgi:hypothetical protein
MPSIHAPCKLRSPRVPRRLRDRPRVPRQLLVRPYNVRYLSGILIDPEDEWGEDPDDDDDRRRRTGRDTDRRSRRR